MTTVTEGPHAGGFLISEAPGTRSRDQIVVAGGQGTLPAGTVISKRAGDSKWVAYDNATSNAAAGKAEGILFDEVDTSNGDVDAVGIVRDAEVNEDEIDWDDNNTGGVTAGTADLLEIGIVLR
jgi:hypothetical protein